MNDSTMNDSIVTLDVREDLRQGREPFTRIMETVALLHGESLRLIAPFEPVPLYRVMRELGFAHETNEPVRGEWHVLFQRQTQESSPPAPATPCGCSGEAVVDVDARGLEPPEPMVRILEALARLAAGQELLARTDRRPLHLYPQLEARGYTGTTEEKSDGSFVTLIRPA